MILYIADRQLKVQFAISTDLPNTYHLKSDSRVDDLDAGVSTLTFTVDHSLGFDSFSKELLDPGNFVLLPTKDDSGKDGYRPYTIITTDDDFDNGTTECYCEDAGLELLNTYCDPDDGKIPKNLATFAKAAIASSGFELGNEADLNVYEKKPLNLSGQTGTERLKAIAEAFDYNFYFEFERGDFNRIAHKYVYFTHTRGNQDPQNLYINKDIKSLKVTRSVEDLATAIVPTGGNNITLVGYEYDDGNYYVEKNTGRLLSRSAYSKWARYLGENAPAATDANITVGYSDPDAVDQGGLLQDSLKELKRRENPVKNYDVELFNTYKNIETLNVGDVVNIVDDAGEIYVQSKIKTITISECDKTVNVVLGDFIELNSGIDDKIKAIASQIAQRLNSMPVYTWIAYADDIAGTNLSKSPIDKDGNYYPYIGIAYNRVDKDYDPATVDPAIFEWSRIKGEDGKPGKDGTSSYTHIAYCNFAPENYQSKYIGDVSYSESTVIIASDYSDTPYDVFVSSGELIITEGSGDLLSLDFYSQDALLGFDSAVVKPVQQDDESFIDNLFGAASFDSQSHSIIISNTDSLDLINVSYMGNLISISSDESGAKACAGYYSGDNTLALYYLKMVDFSITNSSGRYYIGICVNSNKEPPSDPWAYKWTRIRGLDGKNGSNGNDGKDGKDGNTTIYEVNGERLQIIYKT